MINFQFDEKKDAGIITSSFLDEIREAFSVKNEAAFFMRKKYGRFYHKEHMQLHLLEDLIQAYI